MDDFNKFPYIAEALPDVLSKVVRKTAFEIQSDAQSLAPRDTGFLANSIYVKTSKDSSYGQSGKPSKEGASLLQEVEAPPDDQTAYVAVGANYAIYVELGSRYAPAQPFLTPAVEAGQRSLEAAAEEIEGLLKQSIE